MRRAVLFVVPGLYVALGIVHPTDNPEVGDATTLWMSLHLAQLILIAGLAWVLWLLVDGIDNRAARVARALIIPYVVLYTTLDAILGLAWGVVAHQAAKLAPTDQSAAQRLLDEFLLEPSASGYVLYFGAGLLWLAVAVAAVAANARAPMGARMLMAGGAVLFALGHPQPTGPLGMALFLVGIFLLERARATTKAVPNSTVGTARVR
jgi:hypothetical protein